MTSQSKPGKAGLNVCWKHVKSDRRRADGVRVENFPGFTTLKILVEIRKMMTESKCEPEQFKGRIIFMSMYNDIGWTKRGNKEHCFANALRVTE